MHIFQLFAHIFIMRFYIPCKSGSKILSVMSMSYKVIKSTSNYDLIMMNFMQNNYKNLF